MKKTSSSFYLSIKFKYLLSCSLICILFVFSIGLVSCVNISNSHYTYHSSTLINPNATIEAKRLMSFLTSQYGKKIISGQYINEYENFSSEAFLSNKSDPKSRTVFLANELQAVYSVTNDYPVIAGFDISIVLEDRVNYSIEQALEWHNNGGIVNICWHWLVDNFDEKPRAFYTDQTDFNLSYALANKESPQYKGIIDDIDKICDHLRPLQENNVPVLWRPLHEASGGWFWWGASGEQPYKELWDILYDRMTNYHSLNNLIWMANPQDSNWYVGDNKCDIVGDDPYYDYNDRSLYLKDLSNKKRFKKTYQYAKNKMIAMTENDFVPNINQVFKDNCKWLFFCTWCREFVCEYIPDENGNRYTLPNYVEMCSTKAELKSVYSDERVWTLKKLNSSGLYL